MYSIKIILCFFLIFMSPPRSKDAKSGFNFSTINLEKKTSLCRILFDSIKNKQHKQYFFDEKFSLFTSIIVTSSIQQTNQSHDEFTSKNKTLPPFYFCSALQKRKQ